jgi:tetratricopeptide (TPR) repeat protein
MSRGAWTSLLIVTLVAMMGMQPLRCFSQGAEQTFDTANRLYDQGNYAEAAKLYQQIIQQGNASSALYFNLGNALFKSGQLGRAIAVYRALEARTPRDPDLRANLRFALAQVQPPSTSDPLLVSWLRKVSLNEWTIVTCGAFWVTFLLLAVGQIQPRRRTTFQRYAFLTGLLTIFLGACLVIVVRHVYFVPRAIVVVPEATVRRSPINESDPAFAVHNGAELEVLDRNNEWVQVEAGNRSGWIKQEDILFRQEGIRAKSTREPK